jgi:hypothetical protein
MPATRSQLGDLYFFCLFEETPAQLNPSIQQRLRQVARSRPSTLKGGSMW